MVTFPLMPAKIYFASIAIDRLMLVFEIYLEHIKDELKSPARSLMSDNSNLPSEAFKI
ncbi:hypothetical protein [Paenibacillus sp. Soil766]|uniref:hypothetical protein n=1 Tax=Paenibacillus sp. Soil766 TaxID=1736404 RepID=UPI000AE9EE43|nr:hypothetical protein [Paenibacillus sp. Soil766]